MCRKKVSFWLRVERVLVPVVIVLDVCLFGLIGFLSWVYWGTL